MISESRRFAISNVMLVLSIGLLAFVSMDSFGTGCANAATGSCQVGDTETFSSDLGLGGDVIFEGATDDDFETSLTATDPTADRTITMPDYSGDLAVYTGGEGTATQVLTSNGPGVAPSWQNNVVVPDYSTGIEFEGATDDAFETTLSITDPTADRTVTVPDADGTVVLTSNAGAAGEVLVQTGSGVPQYTAFSAGTEEWWCWGNPVSITLPVGGGSQNYYYAVSDPLVGSRCQTVFTDPGYYLAEFDITFDNRTGSMDSSKLICNNCGTADTWSGEMWIQSAGGTAVGMNGTSTKCHTVEQPNSNPVGTSPPLPWSSNTEVISISTCGSNRTESNAKSFATYELLPGDTIDFTDSGLSGLGFTAYIQCSPYGCGAGFEVIDLGPLKMHIVKIG